MGLRSSSPAVPSRAASHDILNQTERHADASRAEPPVPSDPLAEIAADERRDEATQVDPHVEDREAGVAASIVGRVELPDDRADVRLQQPGAEHDQHETGVEKRRHVEREAEVAERDQNAAVKHGVALAEQPVGDPPARNRREVDGRRVQTVDGRRAARLESEPAVGDARRHEQNEERAHPVVAEALPHFGEEQRAQTAGVAEESSAVGHLAGRRPIGSRAGHDGEPLRT